tara:strand:- start:8 stop:625 length:618 start_codon:yes stop_codon:yes gene_type:complete
MTEKPKRYWSQITGQAILGELAGQKLTRISLDTLEWANWKELHPDTKVLSTDTGIPRNYNSDPYLGYYSSNNVMFPVDNIDNRLHLKTLVYGVVINGEAKAYPENDMIKTGLINDIVGGKPILALLNIETGTVKIFERTVEGITIEFKIDNGQLIDTTTNSIWSYSGEGISGKHMNTQLIEVIAPPHFWFAWAAFYPETDLFSAE